MELKVIELLRNELEEHASWRRLNADKYPNDTRNARAVECLTHLASTCKDARPETAARYAALYDRSGRFETIDAFMMRLSPNERDDCLELFSAEEVAHVRRYAALHEHRAFQMKHIGFHIDYADAEELISALVEHAKELEMETA